MSITTHNRTTVCDSVSLLLIDRRPRSVEPDSVSSIHPTVDHTDTPSTIDPSGRGSESDFYDEILIQIPYLGVSLTIDVVSSLSVPIEFRPLGLTDRRRRFLGLNRPCRPLGLDRPCRPLGLVGVSSSVGVGLIGVHWCRSRRCLIDCQ